MTIRIGWRSSSTSASSPERTQITRPAVAREVAADELADRRLVLDQKNVAGHRRSLSASAVIRLPRLRAGFLADDSAATPAGICTRTVVAGAPSIEIVVAISSRRTCESDAGWPAMRT